MEKGMQRFRKLPNTGMHKSRLSAGSVVPLLEGGGYRTLERTEAVVMRPGCTIICRAEDLGIGGLAQFKALTPAPPPIDHGPQADLVVQERESARGYFDVINPANPSKPLNEKALRKGAADELLAQLLGKEDSSGDPDPDLKDDSSGELDTDSSGGSGSLGGPELSYGDDLDDLDWDALVKVLEEAGGKVEDEMENDDDLKIAIRGIRVGQE